MLQFWLNCHFIINFYRVSASAANFYQFFAFFGHFWHKVKLIHLLNNSSFEHGLPSTIYYTHLFLIIITESKRIGLVRKFSFDHQKVWQL